MTPIIVSSYFCIGIALVFFGPLAKRIKREYYLFDINYIDLATQQLAAPWKKISILILMSISIILLWPIFIIDHWWLERQEKIDKVSNASNLPPYNAASDEACRKDPRLYFFKMGGVGVLKCQSCGLMQEVISHVHNHAIELENSWSCKGCQCMDCGKYTTLSSDESRDKVCECGGELSREKPVFCSRCKSYELKYRRDYIT